MEERYGGEERRTTVARRALFQGNYLCDLVALFRCVRFERATSVCARSRVVKLAADLSMAMTTRYRTQWSRAIVRKYVSRLKKTRGQKRGFKCSGNLQKMRSVSVKAKPLKTTAASKKPVSRLRGAPSWYEEEERTSASRMQSLRLLVPGGQRLDTLVLLKETADYFVALKMQVQAMQALANCYTNSSAHAPCHV